MSLPQNSRTGTPKPKPLPRAGLASFIVRSAEGRPNRDLGLPVRVPKPVTAEQAAWLRTTRPA